MTDITRRKFGTTVAAAVAAQPPKQPNIIFFCADQHDGRVMGCNRHPIVKTPNMDRLASMGVLFRNAYAGSAVCCPSRASMMTGRFPSDLGCYCNATAFDGSYPTWGQRLRDAGYHTWATGKLDPSRKAHSDQRVVRNALDFLNGKANRIGKPWVMYMGIEQPKAWGSGGIKKYLDLYPPEKMPLPNIPPGHLEKMHESFQVLRNFHMISFPIPDDRVRRARSAYYARVTEADAYLGSILDNTIFVYTADHGEMLGEHGLWFKNELLEAAARVPLIIAGPGLARGHVVETELLAVLGIAVLSLPQWVLRTVGRTPWSATDALVGLPQWTHNVSARARSQPGGRLRNSGSAPLGQPPKASVDTRRPRQAFREQERRLAELIKRQTAKEFYKDMAPRLGKAQAAILTERYYNS